MYQPVRTFEDMQAEVQVIQVRLAELVEEYHVLWLCKKSRKSNIKSRFTSAKVIGQNSTTLEVVMKQIKNIIPFAGTRSERQRIRQLADQVFNLDYSNSDDVPCLVGFYPDGKHISVLNENHTAWLGLVAYDVNLFDLSGLTTVQGKTYVQHISQFLKPLRRLAG